MSIPTLKSGIRAFYDTMRSGLVPVKVLSVTAPAKPPRFDLRSGLAPVSVKVKAVVTKDTGAYDKGMVIDSNAVHVIPKAAVKRNRYSTTIGLYKVEVDAKSNPGCRTKRNPGNEPSLSDALRMSDQASHTVSGSRDGRIRVLIRLPGERVCWYDGLLAESVKAFEGDRVWSDSTIRSSVRSAKLTGMY